MCLCVALCTWVQVLADPRDIRSPRTGITGGSEPPDVDTGNWTHILYRSSTCSWLLSHLSSLQLSRRHFIFPSNLILSIIINISHMAKVLDSTQLYYIFLWSNLSMERKDEQIETEGCEERRLMQG